MTDLLAAAKHLLHVLSGDHSQGEHHAAVEGLKAAVTAEDPSPVAEATPVDAAPVADAPAEPAAEPAPETDAGAVTE